MADTIDSARTMSTDAEAPAPMLAIASIIVSMALVAVGNGLMFAYIPVRLGAEGYRADLGGLDPHRPVGRRHRRLPADRAAGAPGRPCPRLHGAARR